MNYNVWTNYYQLKHRGQTLLYEFGVFDVLRELASDIPWRGYAKYEGKFNSELAISALK